MLPKLAIKLVQFITKQFLGLVGVKFKENS